MDACRDPFALSSIFYGGFLFLEASLSAELTMAFFPRSIFALSLRGSVLRTLA